MKVFKVGKRGKVTLDRDLLIHLGAWPGAELNVELLPDGRVELRVIPSSGNKGGDVSKAWDDGS
jgi:hypothetical protein